MPTPAARQGNIYCYDFGPIYGAELSCRRRALVISNDDFNSSPQYDVAIVIPTSGRMPPIVFEDHHVHLVASDSWASAWQIKTVEKPRPGDYVGQATDDELDDVLDALFLRFDRRHDPGEIQTAEGPRPIAAGTLWDLTLDEPGHGRFQRTLLVLDYNAGNNMAIVVEVTPGEPSQDSTTSAPVTILATEQVATARVHRVRSIDASQRELRPMGRVRPADVGIVIEKLKTLL
jgi:mRNA-degrading endonuclease toxin of MazEF toxin-antitoxin module